MTIPEKKSAFTKTNDTLFVIMERYGVTLVKERNRDQLIVNGLSVNPTAKLDIWRLARHVFILLWQWRFMGLRIRRFMLLTI